MSSSHGYREFGWVPSDELNSARYVVPAVMDLLKSVHPPGRILDIGCGKGYLAGQLLKGGHRVTGVDLSEEGIALARSTYPDGRFEVLEADETVLEQLGEPAFDAVVSTEVVEHLYAPDVFAAACFAAVRPGGLVVVSTPYHGWLKNVALALTGRFDDHVEALRRGGHIKFWSRQTLDRLLRDAGFEDARFVGAGRLPFLWKSMLVAARRPAVT